MYFTLAVSASTRARCAELVSAATGTDPRVMPVPGPPAVAWRAPSELAAVVHWPASQEREPRSHAGTIWADQAELHARTGLTRVDPVYLVEVPGAVVVSDRASWAAAVAGRLGDPDPVTVAAFLALGYPVGAATPFRGVRALGNGQQLTVTSGRLAAGTARGQLAAGTALARSRPRRRVRPRRPVRPGPATSRPPWSRRSGRWAS